MSNPLDALRMFGVRRGGDDPPWLETSVLVSMAARVADDAAAPDAVIGVPMDVSAPPQVGRSEHRQAETEV